MSSGVAKVLAETGQWSVEERVELLHALWDQLVQAGGPPTLTKQDRAELDRRLDDLNAHPENVLTWEEVLARLRLPQ